MSTVRWDPWGDIADLRHAMNSLFDGNSTRPAATTEAVPLDIKETASEYVVMTPLPGVESSDVEISILRNNLQISGAFKDRDGEQDGTQWLLRERRFGRFARSITLPLPVSAEHASAEFKAGILTIRLPKTEQAQPKTIPVRDGVTS